MAVKEAVDQAFKVDGGLIFKVDRSPKHLKDFTMKLVKIALDNRLCMSNIFLESD